MATSINNIDGLSVSQIKELIRGGGKFVIFPYTVSIILMSYKNSSDIYFIRQGEGSMKYSIGYFFINIIFGWWGFPWGPIYTIGALVDQLKGGKNITQEVLSHLIQNDPDADTNTYNVPSNNSNSNSPYNIPSNNDGSSTPSYNIQ